MLRPLRYQALSSRVEPQEPDRGSAARQYAIVRACPATAKLREYDAGEMVR